MERWIAHAHRNGLDVRHAYPANALIAAARDWQGKAVAVRGLGLSTLDVLRMLTVGLGGAFKDGVYLPSGREPRKILPFALGDKALRSGFDTTASDPATAQAIVAFDGGLKRYSYGPPVIAAAQLLTLLEAGIVSFAIVDDPDVILTGGGWQLIKDDVETIGDVMIDAVIEGGGLDRLTDPLMVDCIRSGMVQPLDDGMGAHIRADGQVIDASGNAVPGLAMLGRLTLGSVIATDGLSDCYGPATALWARNVAGQGAK